MRTAVFLGPEAVTLMQNPTPDGAFEALSLKTGFDFRDRSFDISRLLFGWGPSVGYEGGKKMKSFVSRILSGL